MADTTEQDAKEVEDALNPLLFKAEVRIDGKVTRANEDIAFSDSVFDRLIKAFTDPLDDVIIDAHKDGDG